MYAPTSNAEEAELEQFHEDLQDLVELTPKKDVLSIIGDWNAIDDALSSSKTWRSRTLHIREHSAYRLPKPQRSVQGVELTRSVAFGSL